MWAPYLGSHPYPTQSWYVTTVPWAHLTPHAILTFGPHMKWFHLVSTCESHRLLFSSSMIGVAINKLHGAGVISTNFPALYVDIKLL